MKKFKMHRQEEELVDLYITSLFTGKQNIAIIVIYMMRWSKIRLLWAYEIQIRLSERLQTDPQLTLDKAITMAWWTEAVKEQQAVVGGKTHNTCTRIDRGSRAQLLQQEATNYIPS